MKFYIVGTVGSGKSTLARKMGAQLGVPVYHLDELVHQKNPLTQLGNHRRTDEEIDRIFNEILSQEAFIIEDCLRERFTPALQQVDRVIFIDLPMRILKYRVVKRFLKQKFGMEKANYRPSLQFLRQMLLWLKESPREKIEGLPHLIVLKNKREISRFLENVKEMKK